VEWLKMKALSSSPSTAKKKKKEKTVRIEWSIESYLLGLLPHPNLYGQLTELQFHRTLRNQMKFAGCGGTCL
jgi:FAD synthase